MEEGESPLENNILPSNSTFARFVELLRQTIESYLHNYYDQIHAGLIMVCNIIHEVRRCLMLELGFDNNFQLDNFVYLLVSGKLQLHINQLILDKVLTDIRLSMCSIDGVPGEAIISVVEKALDQFAMELVCSLQDVANRYRSGTGHVRVFIQVMPKQQRDEEKVQRTRENADIFLRQLSRYRAFEELFRQFIVGEVSTAARSKPIETMHILRCLLIFQMEQKNASKNSN